MELSINSLVERIDDFLFERESSRYRAAAGLEAGWSAEALYAGFPELGRVETIKRVAELAQSPRADDTRRARFKLLHSFLAGALAGGRAAPADDRIAEVLRTRTVTAGGRSWSLDESLRSLAREPSSEARELIARELDATLFAEQSLWARRADAMLHVAADLGLPTAEALAELIHGRALPPRLAPAERALAETADASRDLLGFCLRRLDQALRPGAARLHDLERALAAPWLQESFRREELMPAVTRCLGDLGLQPDGRITIDTDARPGRLPGAHVFELRVPDQIRLSLTADAGLPTLAQWLRAWGTAQHRTLVARTLPFVERSLGDRSVVGALGLLFESFLLDPAWLKRYLRLPTGAAREAARVFAWRQTMELRRAAALLPVSRELLHRGPVRPLAEEYAARLTTALHVEVPKGRFLLETPVFADSVVELDAWALETTLHEHLRDRFNEDYWRNPAAGRWLSELASKGQRDDAATVSASVGRKDLDLLPTARRRVAVMGA